MTAPPGSPPGQHRDNSSRHDLDAIVRAAIDGAGVEAALGRAWADNVVRDLIESRQVHAIAAGKAAARMAAVVAADSRIRIASIVAVGTHRPPVLDRAIEWHTAAHPVPDARSIVAGERALALASAVPEDECLLLLLSGGASALLACPAPGVSLADKQHTVRTLLLAGADIHRLNAVRKHLSALKGGRLAAACRGTTLTLAVSDVVGDDLSVIGSGPGVADPSTWDDVQRTLENYGGQAHRPAVRALVQRGVHGDVSETPKGGDPALARAQARIIASRVDALRAAADAAGSLGYDVVIRDAAVVGEARVAARAWLDEARGRLQGTDRLCLLSGGETTVHVTGRGRGGRNQEFALALVDQIASVGREVVAASFGTDGIDGPTDAAGAIVDPTTRQRATALGLDPRRFLGDNNANAFFETLGDLIRTGATDTNVGDIQVLIVR